MTEVVAGVFNNDAAIQPITFNLYTIDPADPLVYANLTLIGTTVENIPAAGYQLINVTISGLVPAGQDLVVEGFAPPVDQVHLATNDNGQTGLSYFAATECGLPEPVDTATVFGTDTFHIVMQVNGYTLDLIITGGATAVTETDAPVNATPDDYTVNLFDTPTGNVTVVAIVDLPAQCEISTDINFTAPAGSDTVTLNFTGGVAPTAQTVYVRPIPDDIDEVAGNNTHPDCVISHSTATSADAGYAALDTSGDNVTVTVTDDDVAGVTVTPNDSEVDEGDLANTATYDVVLDSEPSVGDVVIDVSTDGQCTITSPFSGNSGELTFTGGNWDTPQTVTVVAVDDDIDEASPHDCVITQTMDAAQSSDEYDAINPDDVTVDVLDDDTAGVTVTPNDSEVDEGDLANTATYDVVLDSEPSVGDVVIDVSTDGQCTITSPFSGNAGDLTFTAGSWDTPQTVTVVAVDDFIDEANPHDCIITQTVNAGGSSDDYDAVDPDDVTVDVLDDDTAGIVVDPLPNPETISEFGPTATTFGLQLQTEPSAGTVTIDISTDAQCTLLASAGVTVVAGVGSVVFDNTTWNVPVPVTVEAIDDLDIEGDHQCVVSFVVSQSDAVEYDGLVLSDLIIPVEDNDGASNFAKQFQFEGPLPTFSTVNLFFTLRNTNGGTLYNVTFTDELPENLTLASISAQVTDLDWEVSADCGDLAPSVDTVVGGSTLTFEGGTLESGAVCEVRVVVTSQFPGTYTNAPANITAFAADGNPDLEVAFDPTSVTFEYADNEVFGGTGEVAIDPSLDVFDPAISKIGVLQPGQTGVTGEQLEWIVTVTNPSSVGGTNVVITDTINSSMTVDNVVASGGTSAIDGQTVTVTYATLAAGQSVSFSIFTTVVDGLFLDNTACLVADGVAQECASASVTSTELPSVLPATGDSPYSALRLPMLILLGLALLVGVRWRRKVSA